MNDERFVRVPPPLDKIKAETKNHGFAMGSDDRTGSLLRTLASAKPGGRLLELGTGTGLATAWILSGMDQGSRLATVDTDEAVVAVARSQLGGDPRVSFVVEDAATYLARAARESLDFVFADAWPGKYEHTDQALALLKPGGFYVIDDMSPQPNWPDGHQAHVQRLLEELEARSDLFLTKLCWSTGLVLATKRSF